ncbi:nucleoside 2-deoxyribosyltransferase domain-containing protein [Thermomonospora umbrina]|uniref:Nucleoside 2-deoxyribosyltransferase-like protein n=1 Tax=Thermomonospora umbrina TaxID=111806 RepID=A0A3D9SVH9_9ACTN|nr:nucleoside 2-deoxyribosyltransferase domain-containing protein [Thermomonospora umbrina]REE99808.1 nucleoside 2-deoxyribosyltransferase-like protein [Thermomonospora umbrina]
MEPEVLVVHALEEPPESWEAAVFLAGPTPRAPDVPSWRPEAVERIRARWAVSGRLVVFVPEHRDRRYVDYTGQVDWEERCLHLADEVVFWVPRDMETMPALTTNVEWGMWHDSGRVVFGAPPEAPKNRYLLHYAERFGVPTATTLDGVVAAALDRIGDGSSRIGGEREVPLLVWRTPEFRQWYETQRGADNVLRGARVVWRTGLHWGLHVAVEVAAEGRVKANEVVFSRPDISAVLLYRPGPTPDETVVVLVREFRSPASTEDGCVHELPGGSGPGDPLSTAVAEVAEETGLVLDPARLRRHGVRQVNATMSAHRAHLFSAEITEDELAAVRDTGPHGLLDEGERTYVEAATFAEIRRAALVDWATLGMIAEALYADR